MPKSVQIHIPQPCHENWHNMTPKEQGHFCGSCQKTVVDFSAMSDKELLTYLSKAAGKSVCGRFVNNQLNRKLETATVKRRFSLAYFWNLLLAAGLLFTESCKQSTKGMILVEKALKEDRSTTVVPPVTEVGMQRPPLYEIKGQITSSETGLPVAGARVCIPGTKREIFTGLAGEFRLYSENRDSVTLEVSAQDYSTATLKLDSKTDWRHLKMAINKMYIMGFPIIKEAQPVWLRQNNFDKGM